MTNKTKLIYVTEEQQLWLSNLVLDRIHNPLDTNDIVLAAAFIKKLRGRTTDKTENK
jgi:hypothetical protein